MDTLLASFTAAPLAITGLAAAWPLTLPVYLPSCCGSMACCRSVCARLAARLPALACVAALSNRYHSQRQTAVPAELADVAGGSTNSIVWRTAMILGSLLAEDG